MKNLPTKYTSYHDDLIIEMSKDGVYFSDMPNEKYHSLEGISKTGLDLIERSPAHYKYKVPVVQTRPMQMGSAIHAAILEPEVFSREYMMLPEIKDRRQAEYRKAKEVYGEERVFTGSDCQHIKDMQTAVYAHSEARRLLEQDGYSELSGIVRDPVTGVLCRHRFDRLAVVDGWAVDLKKTQDASPDGFSKSVANYRYHVQAAFYLDQYEWITGERLKGMKFIAVEEKPCHGVGVYYLDDGSLHIGREAYRKNLNTYAECLNTEKWDCYAQDSQMISLPNWALAAYENELEDGGII